MSELEGLTQEERRRDMSEPEGRRPAEERGISDQERRRQ
jgi:hypothetical protein